MIPRVPGGRALVPSRLKGQLTPAVGNLLNSPRNRMRIPGAISGRVWIFAAAAFLISCATTTPSQKIRTFFVPPAHPAPARSTPALDLPNISTAVGLAYFANQVPHPSESL